MDHQTNYVNQYIKSLAKELNTIKQLIIKEESIKWIRFYYLKKDFIDKFIN